MVDHHRFTRNSSIGFPLRVELGPYEVRDVDAAAGARRPPDGILVGGAGGACGSAVRPQASHPRAEFFPDKPP